jgi:hypothetical protein
LRKAPLDPSLKEGVCAAVPIKERERFVESLTHDCIVIQVPLLKDRRRTDLERLLTVFDQERAEGDPHQLSVLEEDLPERYQEVLRRLQRAMAVKEVRDTMDLEDEVVSLLVDKDRALEAKDRVIEDLKRVLEATRRQGRNP